ncbi:NUDIX hydrolase [Streptococcus panodentis]|uniref:NTP pyrophosphohydrolase n=1 Tax=Streptococcus panodentis TaxID=1581472 RepID=A0ABS5AXK0_9STRE|nr:NUDIX domain-containing protein [Streptococcus panodentis]MBP2620449.1 NTP pyrophosphohydrolase [Streptococcus panodentis]
MSEIWNAYDLNRNKLPRLLVRGEPVPEGLFHLCVNVFVRHADGELLFMRRAASKSLYPGYYECGAGGSVLAGESSRTAALRELEEETGLVPDSIRLIAQASSAEDQCHFDYYEAAVSADKGSVRYQAGETDAHLWLPLSAVADFMETHPFFRHQKEVLSGLID